MRVVWLIALSACAGSKPAPAPISEPQPAEPSEPASPTSEPDGPQGTDEDGDGFTVEGGDCDDSDPWTNPARDEEPGDGQDNDCDGRVDEIWAGLTVALQTPTSNKLLIFNTLGGIESEFNLGPDCAASYLTHSIDHDSTGGYVATVGGSILGEPPSKIATIDGTGNCSILHDFMPAEGEELPEGEQPYVRDIITHPDGYYLATKMDSLLRIDVDGTITVLEEWSADPADTENYLIQAWTLAIDIVTKEVALFGLYGDFATWNEGQGITLHKSLPLEDPSLWDGLYTYSGVSMDGGGFFTLSLNANDGNTAIQEFNFATEEFDPVAEWTPPVQTGSIFPLDIASNGDAQDFYVAANVATFHTIWRVRTVDSSIYDLYKSDSMPNYKFQGMITNYGVE